MRSWSHATRSAAATVTMAHVVRRGDGSDGDASRRHTSYSAAHRIGATRESSHVRFSTPNRASPRRKSLSFASLASSRASREPRERYR